MIRKLNTIGKLVLKVPKVEVTNLINQ